MIYRFVDILNAAGINSAVVHRSKNFRCTWFANETIVVGGKDIRFGKGDLLVLPEWYRELLPYLAPGVPNVVFNQNAYETYSDVPYTRGTKAPVLSSDTIGIVGISEDSIEYLRLCFPDVRVDGIRLSIDSDLFHPSPKGKSKTIAYMPRKRLKELNQILHILESRGSLDGWELLPIDGATEAEVAGYLGGAAIFIALNEREGIALPSLEAMASGCVVVGFRGSGGKEYMEPDATVPIGDGEVAWLVAALELEMRRFEDEDPGQIEMSKKAISLVSSRYSPERERDDVIAVFSEALARVAEVTPGSTHLDVKFLPPTDVERKKIAQRLSRKNINL